VRKIASISDSVTPAAVASRVTVRHSNCSSFRSGSIRFPPRLLAPVFDRTASESPDYAKATSIAEIVG